MPGPLISKAQSGRVNIRTTQQVGRTWQERFLINVRSVDGRALLAAVDDYWRNGTIFTISHVDHLTPVGTGGGSPLIHQPTQLVTNPENFGAWIPGGTPVLTAGQADPFGGTAAYLIDDNDGAVREFIYQVVTFTGDGEKCVGLFVRLGTDSGDTHFSLFDNTAAAHRHLVKLTWPGGVPSLATTGGSGTRYALESHGGGWWRVQWSAVGVIAANVHRLYIEPARTAALTGTLYIFGANAWNAATPAGYTGPSHLTATGSRIYADGATASVTNWLRAGDILSVGGLAPTYEVTANVNSEAGGYASIPINPPIFEGGAPADNAAVTITGVTMNACILEPPDFPTTSGQSADYGTLGVTFSESL